MADNETKGVNAPLAGFVPTDLSASNRDRQRIALSALFEAEFTRIYGFLYARCGSATMAEDVASETFTDAARAVNAGRGAEVSTSWLFMVARRRLIDRWRSDDRHRRRLERLRMMRTSTTEGSANSPDVALTGSHAISDEHVLAALSSLPTRQRAALTLRYLDEYSVSEIAETLDVTYRAAESLLSRARASFANAYGGGTDA